MQSKRAKCAGGCVAALLVALLAGCGSGADSPPAIGGGSGPQTDEVAKAMLDDPVTATQILPLDHLDPMVLPRTVMKAAKPTAPEAALEVTVSSLESNYEIAFCGLSAKFKVTMNTPEVQAKINFIKSQSGTGYFDLTKKPILNNSAGVTGVRFEPVTYAATVELPTGGNQTYNVSGGLLLPLGIDKSKVKGIIVYFHGTSFSKSTVGSVYTGNFETQLLSQVFASQGYIVAIPDYIGQGVDYTHVHPYVIYPKMTAKTAVDMLAAIKSTIAGRYGVAPSDPPLKLFSAGYSEGGANSVWFNSFLSSSPNLLDPFYRLTHSVGMEGAYSTSQVTKGFIFDDVNLQGTPPNMYNIQNQVVTNLVKPLLSADAFLSYAAYSLNSNYAGVFNPDFFSLTATDPLLQSLCNVEGQHVDMASAFARPNTMIAQQVLVAALGKTGNGATFPGVTAILTSHKNSVNPLVASDFLSAASQAKLDQVLQAADVDLGPVADSGVSIITLAHDSVVVPNNFDVLLAKYPAKIKSSVKIDENQILVVSPFSDPTGKALFPKAKWVPVDHMQAPVFEFLYALNIFSGY